MSVTDVIRGLLRDPIGLLAKRWNWKASLLSSLMRAGIFFAVNLRAGWEAATAAMLTQFVFRAVTSGYYAALTQAFRKAEPAWAAALTVTLALPALTHTAEFLVHWAQGTPRLGESLAASVAFTMLSTLFNWYAMRRGVLLVGEASAHSLAGDFRRMPRVVLGFLAAPFIALCQRGGR